MGTVFIYALTHEESDKVYIGKTGKTGRRLSEHLSDAKAGKTALLYCWIRSHLDNPEGFEMQVVEEVDEQEWEEAERAWIAWFRENWEARVLNTLDGGEGFPSGPKHPRHGTTYTEAEKKKLSEAHRGHRHSPETKRKIGEAQRGAKNHNFGKTTPSEVREKIRESCIELSDFQVMAIRVGYARNVMNQTQLAEFFDCSPSHISKLVNGRRRTAAGGPIKGVDYEID